MLKASSGFVEIFMVLFGHISVIIGLYYKRIMIVIDSPSVVSKWRSKLEHHLLTIIIDDAS